jgi:hypothetical protein
MAARRCVRKRGRPSEPVFHQVLYPKGQNDPALPLRAFVALHAKACYLQA